MLHTCTCHVDTSTCPACVMLGHVLCMCAVVCCVVIVGEHVTVMLAGGEMASDLARL